MAFGIWHKISNYGQLIYGLFKLFLKQKVETLDTDLFDVYPKSMKFSLFNSKYLLTSIKN